MIKLDLTHAKADKKTTAQSDPHRLEACIFSTGFTIADWLVDSPPKPGKKMDPKSK
jgi:hypothetical protein